MLAIATSTLYSIRTRPKRQKLFSQGEGSFHLNITIYFTKGQITLFLYQQYTNICSPV